MAVNEHNGSADDARLARLYRDAAREEPPARLDRAIEAAAREGVQRPAAPRASSWWTPWRIPFAFAAVTVVCVSLAALMIEEDPERVAAVPASPPANYEREQSKLPQSAPEVPAATADRETSSATASSAAPAEQGPGLRAPQRQDSRERKREPAAATDHSPAELARGEAPAAAMEADRRALQKAPAPEAAPQPAPGGLGAADQRASGEVQAARPEDRAFAPPPPATAAKPAPASPPQPFIAEKARAPAAKPAPTPRRSIGVRGLESEGTLQATPSPEVARHVAELDNKPPAAWIERVVTLRREGRVAEANGVLAEFRRRYPAEAIPPELQ